MARISCLKQDSPETDSRLSIRKIGGFLSFVKIKKCSLTFKRRKKIEVFSHKGMFNANGSKFRDLWGANRGQPQRDCGKILTAEMEDGNNILNESSFIAMTAHGKEKK